ncbi:hypothetical protein WK13_34740 [Burkholderia ubonensis]|uniref:DUF1653 domain-containing protein n=1 Tax=Burkholderia ubonensis TaxID=101571 RepID=UPI00075AA364|nr:DUF1653 domain-containing protein [Burkholderia ubonensis]KVR21698.1 hypothetical protein WK13_34740 [Burkholderia ubonensis]
MLLVNSSNHPSLRARHYKGGLYEVIGHAVREQDGADVVLYVPVNAPWPPTIYTRPNAEFYGWVESDGKQVRRYELEVVPPLTVDNPPKSIEDIAHAE